MGPVGTRQLTDPPGEHGDRFFSPHRLTEPVARRLREAGAKILPHSKRTQHLVASFSGVDPLGDLERPPSSPPQCNPRIRRIRSRAGNRKRRQQSGKLLPNFGEVDQPGVCVDVRHCPEQYNKFVCGTSATPGEDLSSLEVPQQSTTSVFATVVDDKAKSVQAIGDSCQPSREFRAVAEVAGRVPVSNTGDRLRIVEASAVHQSEVPRFGVASSAQKLFLSHFVELVDRGKNGGTRDRGQVHLDSHEQEFSTYT